MKSMKKSIKSVAAIFLTVILVFALTSVTAFADSVAVAKIGDTPYTSIASAIEAVEDGGTIQLLAGEFDEVVETGRISKSFTIVGAEDFATVLTGGIKIGTDNSSKPIQECTVTVKGIVFKNNPLDIFDVRNAVVEGNKFENVEKYAIRIIDSATDGQQSSIVVKNNYVDGAEQGIRIRTPHTVEITGNTIKNTQHNSITLEHGKWSANSGSFTIANNTFENWALGGEGRVVRSEAKASELEKQISFTGNKMLREEEPLEEYVKFTGAGTNGVNLEKNYWNSEEPDFETIIAVNGVSVAPAEYYKAVAMSEKDLNTYQPKNEWVYDNEEWYFFDANGAMVTGWLLDGDTWYYLGTNGAMVTGWLLDGNTWYYLNTNGAMATGWLLDGNTWYYLNTNGAMATGWLLDGNTWYYLNTNGAMATGWLLDGNTWYYLNTNGAMATGWLLDGNTWYYLNTNGAMATGWLLDGNTWYFLNTNGAMATNCYIGIYYVGANGAWIK